MKILITGGTGYIGSHLANRFSALKHEVWALDDLSNSSADSLNADVHFIKADICRQQELFSLLGEHRFDTIIHCAAEVDADKCQQDPARTLRINLTGTAHMLEYAHETKIKNFIFSSSAAVYGNTDNNSIDESHGCRPLHPYAESKLSAENLLLAHAENSPDFNLSLLRYFNVAGNGIKPGSNALFSKILNCAATDSVFTINGSDYPTADGTCIRDFIHIEDLIEIHLRILHRKPGSSLILNCGSGKGYSVLQVIQAMNTVLPQPVKYQFGPRRAHDVACVVSNNTRLQQILQWQPKHSALENLCATLK